LPDDEVVAQDLPKLPKKRKKTDEKRTAEKPPESPFGISLGRVL
jgi:hypothetical protein